MLRKLLTLSEKTLDVSFLAARPDSVALVADKTAKDSRGLLYFAAPCT